MSQTLKEFHADFQAKGRKMVDQGTAVFNKGSTALREKADVIKGHIGSFRGRFSRFYQAHVRLTLASLKPSISEFTPSRRHALKKLAVGAVGVAASGLSFADQVEAKERIPAELSVEEIERRTLLAKFPETLSRIATEKRLTPEVIRKIPTRLPMPEYEQLKSVLSLLAEGNRYTQEHTSGKFVPDFLMQSDIDGRETVETLLKTCSRDAISIVIPEPLPVGYLCSAILLRPFNLSDSGEGGIVSLPPVKTKLSLASGTNPVNPRPEFVRPAGEIDVPSWVELRFQPSKEDFDYATGKGAQHVYSIFTAECPVLCLRPGESLETLTEEEIRERIIPIATRESAEMVSPDMVRVDQAA